MRITNPCIDKKDQVQDKKHYVRYTSFFIEIIPLFAHILYAFSVFSVLFKCVKLSNLAKMRIVFSVLKNDI